ncbi:TPA: hypothetical protein MJA79_15360 [Klebsiella pneumoniae]|jgi:NTP pyrophosphatase (non-canonical NTP hydrolase)|nr:hypothetical protein [Klebsiella pneumoniae]VFS20545.1 Uncharacterised protein [Serratia liquefaciens]DAL30491.1 MAG TPA_asm: nucleoside triphosphate pyrophosphohydrolase [Caudoviricetes sp.]RLO18720.1 hypothetical protein D1220_24615 [Klebsiella pneumoniae]RLO18793.1 hypothetical protein D1220_25060 [Klebsiella pneumoniae]SQC25855.1 Uncharacterised protein [Klebsiella pneumoniae]
MNTKNTAIYDAALSKWGFESQVLVLSEEASELAASCSRFLNKKTDSTKVAEEAADVEIMIEQLRHNGMGPMIDHEKNRKMTRLAQVVGVGVESQLVSPFGPSVQGLLEEVSEQLELADTLYRDTKTSNRYAAARVRMAVSLLMQAAQKMIREQQFADRQQAGDGV